MAEKKRKWRRRRYDYLDDYKINEKGEYEYKGKRYLWNVDKALENQIRMRLRIFSVLAFILALLAGCIPAPGVNRVAYLLLPYAISVAATVSVWLATWRMCGETNPMKEHVFNGSAAKLPFRTGVTAVAAGLCVIAEIIYLIIDGSGGTLAGAVGFILLEGAALSLSIWIRRCTGAEKWELIP